jgi:hypothetical protein
MLHVPSRKAEGDRLLGDQAAFEQPFPTSAITATIQVRKFWFKGNVLTRMSGPAF